MPVRATIGDGKLDWLSPTAAWKTWPGTVAATDSVKVDPNFYVFTKNAATPAP